MASLASHATKLDLSKLHLINGCSLYSATGKHLRAFPGGMCIFLEDGSLISANETHMRLINKNSEVVWDLPGHFHHQINISPDRKSILALSSEVIDTPKGKFRDDVALVISMEGKILHRQTNQEILRQSGQESLILQMNPQLTEMFGTNKETSHFNSIYKIPRISNKNVPSYIKEGNIIVNGLVLGIHILSPDLKTVLFHKKFDSSYNHWVHDVQVKENGNVIFFNNVDAIPGKEVHNYVLLTSENLENYSSSIQELDPMMKKVVWNFSANPKSLFFSWICGSVQELDNDTILFTHYLSGTYIYSKSKKTTVATVAGTHTDHHRIIPSQQVKAQDLTLFLSHWELPK